MSNNTSTPRLRKRSLLTGKVIPRCHCGKAVYADGKCWSHHTGGAVVCNLASYFGLPDVGYQPHHGRKAKR